MPMTDTTCAFAGSVSVTFGPTGGVPTTVAMFVCCTPGAGAGNVAVQRKSSSGWNGPGTTLLFNPSHLMLAAGITLSVTVTFINGTLPMFVTSKVIVIVEPCGTATPGAVSASTPLMNLMIAIAGSAGTIAFAGSSSVTVVFDGVVPTTVPMFVCCTPGAGAGSVAVHVNVPCGATESGFTLSVPAAPPQSMFVASLVTTLSVTVTFVSGTLPVFLTSNVTFIV